MYNITSSSRANGRHKANDHVNRPVRLGEQIIAVAIIVQTSSWTVNLLCHLHYVLYYFAYWDVDFHTVMQSHLMGSSLVFSNQDKRGSYHLPAGSSFS